MTTTTSHGLTPGQMSCWYAIAEYMDEHGIPPAISDLMKHFGLRSRSLVQGRVDALKEAGIVETQKNIPRSMVLKEYPPPR